MKRMISLLSVILSAFLIFSAVVPYTIFAAEPKVDETVVKSELLKAIGIDIDTKAISVKRGEFVSYIADTFNLSQIKFCGTLPYTDISEKDSFYNDVGILYDLGVLSPGEKFNPAVNISGAEVAKIIVSAMGYDYIAQAKGGYPGGYLAVANSMDISISFGDTIDGKMLTDIIFSTLSAAPNYVSADNSIPGSESKNGFYVYHNITEAEGIVTSNNITSLYSHIDETEGDKITIDGRTYEVDPLITDGERTAAGSLGAYIKAFVYDFGGEDEKIIFFDSSESKFVSLNGSDAAKNGFEISAIHENNEKSYKLSADFSVILNGKLCDDFTDADFENPDGRILLIDNDSDGKYEIVSVENPEYIIAESFNSLSGYISDKNSSTYGTNNVKIIDLTDEDAVYEYYMYIGNECVVCSAEDLESFKSFELVMSRDQKYVRLTGFSNVVSGNITEISDAQITIETSTYSETLYSDKNNIYVPFGSYLSAYLTPDNKIIYIESDENSLTYGVLMKIAREGGMGDYRAALLTATGNKQTVYFDKKLVLDGETVSVDFSDTNSIAYTKLFDKPQLIKYSINKNGEFAVIDISEDTTDFEALSNIEVQKDPKNSLTKYTDITELDVRSSSYTTCLSPYLVPRTVKIFTVPKILSTSNAHTYEFNMNDFDTINIEEFPNTNATIAVYDISRNRDAGAIVVYADVEKGSIPPLGSRSTNAVIDRITDSVNEDGDVVKKVTYITVNNGKSEAVFTTGQFTVDFQKEYNRVGYDFKPGDYVYVARSGEEIANMIPVVYYNSWSINKGIGLDVKCSDYLTLDFCAKGVLVDLKDSVISVLVDDDDPDDGYDNKRIVAFPVPGMKNLVRFNPDSDCFEKISIDDVKTVYNSSMDSADRVVIRSAYHEIFGIALYSVAE